MKTKSAYLLAKGYELIDGITVPVTECMTLGMILLTNKGIISR